MYTTIPPPPACNLSFLSVLKPLILISQFSTLLSKNVSCIPYMWTSWLGFSKYIHNWANLLYKWFTLWLLWLHILIPFDDRLNRHCMSKSVPAVIDWLVNFTRVRSMHDILMMWRLICTLKINEFVSIHCRYLLSIVVLGILENCILIKVENTIMNTILIYHQGFRDREWVDGSLTTGIGTGSDPGTVFWTYVSNILWKCGCCPFPCPLFLLCPFPCPLCSCSFCPGLIESDFRLRVKSAVRQARRVILPTTEGCTLDRLRFRPHQLGRGGLIMFNAWRGVWSDEEGYNNRRLHS